MSTLTTDRIREIERTPKQQLADRVVAVEREHGRSWAVGGPHQWSKQELVSAVCRIERGEEL